MRFILERSFSRVRSFSARFCFPVRFFPRYQMKLLAKCLVRVYMTKTINDRQFVWWGTPDRHILVPHLQSYRLG